MGLLSLHLWKYVLPERYAFAASCLGVLVGITVAFWAFLRPLDRGLSLPAILAITTAKVAFVYLVWANCVFAPGDGQALSGAESFFFAEPLDYWDDVKSIKSLWETAGFTFILPSGYVQINHPEAMLLVALPFSALPAYSEVLIPWNMLYTTICAACIYAIGRLEGFGQGVSRIAFYCVMLQPFGWYVLEPLKRDTQAQALFGIFLLGALICGRRSLPAASLAFAGLIMLSFYRVVYGPIFVCVMMLHYMRSNSGVHRRLLAIATIVLAFSLYSAMEFPGLGLKGSETLEFYGFGNIERTSEVAYQRQLGGADSWFGSIPGRMALAMLSPFPWTGILESNSFAVVAIWAVDYSHTALMLVCFSAIAVFGFQDLKQRRKLPLSVVFAVAIAASGTLGIAVHNVYVQIGMLSTFPYVIQKVGIKRLGAGWICSIFFFIVASLLYRKFIRPYA